MVILLDHNMKYFFSAFMTNAAQKLNDYWNEKRGGENVQQPQTL